MTNTKTATGFIAQDHPLSYATPQISQLTVGADSWAEACELAGLDWEPEVRPLRDTLHDIVIPGVHAIWNGPTFLGSASARHKLISHATFGEVVTTIQHKHGNAPITALVVLDNGRRIGARVTHGDTRVAGDPSPIARESWAWLRHDAQGSLSVFENAQRMLCTNQLGRIAERRGDLRVRHTGDVAAKTARLVTLLARSEDDWKLWEAEMAQLRLTKVTDEQFDRFTRIFIPEPLPPVKTSRALNTQAKMNSLWRHYREELGPNAYAGFQTIAEFEDKRRIRRGAVGRFQTAIQPNPVKGKALRMLVQVARG